MFRTFYAILVAALLLSSSCRNGVSTDQNQLASLQFNEAYEDTIDHLLSKMDLKTKVGFVHCTGKFVSGGNEELGIPEFWYADGPNSVREELERHTWKTLNLTTDSVTFFPTGTALAATWSTEMALKYGKAIGKESRARKKDMLLGPAVNIIRTPVCGRTFEYFTEDPYLNSRIAVEYVNGLQSMDVAACVKHFAANNQEHERGRVSVEMSERALREIYLPVYKATVQEANALGMMGAYNKFRGDYLCQNDYLNNKVLKDDFGFKGIVISDWGATHNTVTAALGGLDVEMGTRESYYDSCYFGTPLVEAVKEGKVPESVVDDKVRRILRVTYNLKMLDEKNRAKGELTSPAIKQDVYTIASEAIVLLKNKKSILPIKLDNTKSVAIIGANAKQPQSFGGHTAPTKAKWEVSPYEGIKSRLGDKVTLTYSPGYEIKYEEEGRGNYPYNKPNVQLIDDAIDVAKKADVAILVVGNTRNMETEGVDRRDIFLPFGQDQLIKEVSKANPNTIVVVVAGSACDLNVAKEYAPAILYSWFNGSEAGNALADVLIGKTNPSGKMPFTLPKKLEDIGAHSFDKKTYPEEDLVVNYTEDILVGYRWFDTKNIEPLFPFGYGLSYTSFDYLSATADKEEYNKGETVKLKVVIKNTGNVTGKEVVQCYMHANNSKVTRAQKELKAFVKIEIPAGSQKEVGIPVKVDDFAYYNEEKGNWELEPGRYTLMIGASSRGIKQQVEVEVVGEK